jgi:hypothetical protein
MSVSLRRTRLQIEQFEDRLVPSGVRAPSILAAPRPPMSSAALVSTTSMNGQPTNAAPADVWHHQDEGPTETITFVYKGASSFSEHLDRGKSSCGADRARLGVGICAKEHQG